MYYTSGLLHTFLDWILQHQASRCKMLIKYETKNSACWFGLGLALFMSGCAQLQAPLEREQGTPPGVTVPGQAAVDPVAPPSVVTAAPKPAQSKLEIPAEAHQEYQSALKLMRDNDTKKSITAFEQMSTKFPQLSSPFANLGILYQKEGRFEDAEKALNQAIRLNNQIPTYYNQLGILYRKLGKFSDARTAYENAIRLDSNYNLAHLNIGILFDLYLGDADKALVHYTRYQNLQSQADKQVAGWIADLLARNKSEKKSNNLSKAEP